MVDRISPKYLCLGNKNVYNPIAVIFRGEKGGVKRCVNSKTMDCCSVRGCIMSEREKEGKILKQPNHIIFFSNIHPTTCCSLDGEPSQVQKEFGNVSLQHYGTL